MSRRALIFLSVVYLLGASTLAYGASTWKIENPAKFLAYLAMAILASRLKVMLPEITGSVSVNFLFILIGIVELNFTETLCMGCAAILAQSYMNRHKWPTVVQVLFNLGSASFAIGAAYFVYHGPLHARMSESYSLLLLLSACAYFVLNTLPVAAIISLTEEKSLRAVWTDCYFWSFPYYLVGAAIAGMVSWMNKKVSWQTSLFALPVMFVIHHSYRLYLSKL